LILLDQAIKIFIAVNYMDTEFDLPGGILAFKPYINEYYSWINSVFQMGIGLMAHILLNALIVIITMVIYGFVRDKNPSDKYVGSLFAFVLAGGLCSLIDKLAWGGSLDYIWLKGFFIFDLKDVYLTVFDCLLIAAVLFNYKDFRKISTGRMLSELLIYIKNRYLRTPNKK
jgi:signal peptidase II